MLARTHPFSSKSRGSLECHPGYHGAERYRTLPRAITFSCIPSKYIENAKGKEEKRKKEKTKEKKNSMDYISCHDLADLMNISVKVYQSAARYSNSA